MNGWIPVKWHKLTEEEKAEEGYPEDWAVHIDSLMPDDGQEILLTVKYTNRRTGSTEYYVEKDTCFNDGDGYYLDSSYDWIDDVIAWMPLPEPYKGE